jgi:hypothetical protein
MDLKKIKKSNISWPTKVRWIAQHKNHYSPEELAQRFGYRIDYLREQLTLAIALYEVPELSLYTRKEALRIIKTFKTTTKIRQLIELEKRKDD